MAKKVRMGMVGGGKGAFIGAVHRAAANLDGRIQLVCGAFSSNSENTKATGELLHLSPERCYETYTQMFAAEARLDKCERMQFVVIVTPNHLHYPIAKAAIEAGFHVLSDKPACFNLAEAIALKQILQKHNVLYGLTHTYTGYPLIKEAKSRVKNGELGKITKIVVEYSQGWLSQKTEASNKQASWRLDPKQAGISCCIGDIGVHAANLAEYVSELQITQLCADLQSVVPDRELDDDANVLLRFNNGAKGVLIASQVSVGEENNLNLRIYGSKASITWDQQEPNSLIIKYPNTSSQIIRTGVGTMSDSTAAAIRVPAGHPEGYLEAFANLYSDFAQLVEHFEVNGKTTEQNIPGIEDAIRGMAFIENCVAASHSEKKWYPFYLNPQYK